VPYNLCLWIISCGTTFNRRVERSNTPYTYTDVCRPDDRSDVKPIPSVEQSGLEFLITADNDTYVDLNIILYIRGNLLKADGTNLDNTDFTAVTNNFLHSLISQCSTALNGVTITQATEL